MIHLPCEHPRGYDNIHGTKLVVKLVKAELSRILNAGVGDGGNEEGQTSEDHHQPTASGGAQRSVEGLPGNLLGQFMEVAGVRKEKKTVNLWLLDQLPAPQQKSLIASLSSPHVLNHPLRSSPPRSSPMLDLSERDRAHWILEEPARSKFRR